MIQILWTGGMKAGLETAATLTASLRAADIPAALVAEALPEDLTPAQTFDIARMIAPAHPGPDDRLLVIAGHCARDGDFATLRRPASTGHNGCTVTGHFGSVQAEIGVRSKFSYALGREPDLLALPDESTGLIASSEAPVFGIDHRRRRSPDGRLRVLLIAPDLAKTNPTAFQALAVSRKLAVTILADGKAKNVLRAAGIGTHVYHYTEVPLRSHVGLADVAVFCQPVPNSYAMRMLLADLVASGVGLLDASEGFANRKREPAFVPAPAEPAALSAFLTNEIRPDLAELDLLSRGSASALLASKNLADLRQSLGLADGERAVVKGRPLPVPPVPDRVVFLPTNGVGLGHAQRCLLIAEDLVATSLARPDFAAFPSCMRLIKSRGFDVMPLVQKSGQHADPLANDIVNYARLGPRLDDAAAFVFDGGYVFNSIFRSVLERGLPSIWVRRGLWRGEQDNSVALEREKVFDRVIVPLEAFDELNEDYSHGPKVTKVGPIVQKIALSAAEREMIRSELADRFAMKFRHLVVTMLGGGVAADRSAQTTAIAAGLARRTDVLHLVVTWPTATVDPGHFAWPNTRIVRTHHASALAAVADLYISAVGYNSFHESMYNRIPTIFVPQVAAFMDDQRARAIAAVERDLARLVDPHELMTLDRTILRMLDQGEAQEMRARLSTVDLPPPGNAASASCICETASIARRDLRDLKARRIA
jgi:hypothetical protein